MWFLLPPHLSADKVSDKAVQVTPCHDWIIPVLVRESFGSETSPTSKVYGKLIPAASNSDTIIIWHIVLCTVIWSKCAAVWEDCVWSCVSSCWENVSDAYHPKVTARGGAGGGARRESEVRKG